MYSDKFSRFKKQCKEQSQALIKSKYNDFVSFQRTFYSFDKNTLLGNCSI